MRVFDVIILVVSGEKSERHDERYATVDFHAACIFALNKAKAANGRVLSVTEVKQQPRLVS